MSQHVRLALCSSPPSHDTILFLCPVKVILEHQIKERKDRQVVLFRLWHQICAYTELIDPEEKNIDSDLSYIHQSISLGPRVSQCFPQILQCVYLHLLTLGPSCVRWPVSDERQFLGLLSVCYH